MKSILVICRDNLLKAPRFMMELDALHDKYKLIAAGNEGETDGGKYKFVKLQTNTKRRADITFHLNYPVIIRKPVSAAIKLMYGKKLEAENNHDAEYKVLSAFDYDLVLVHHLKDVPLAVKLAKKKNVKIIFNAHEYYPLEFEDVKQWMDNVYPKFMKIAREQLRHVEICFCVGAEIAKKYKEEFNLNSIVVANTKEYHSLPASQTNGEKIRIIHHGAAIRSRKIEEMIEMMKFLPGKYELNLILVATDQNYILELKELSKQYKNIHFLEPVATRDISAYINKFDIGLFLLPPTNFNYRNALPNKFFEFVQARLAIAIGPSPEMAELVKKHDLGVVSNDFKPESLATEILKMDLEKINYYKQQCDKHAHELSSEKTISDIRVCLDNLISN